MRYLVSTLRLIAVVVLASSLSACATNTAVLFDRATAGDIKTIGLLPPAMPEQPTAFVAAAVGRNFGLIGALVESGIQSNRESNLATLLQGQNFVAGKALTENLVTALNARGYSVAMVPVNRVKTDAFIDQYPSASQTHVDAYLDVISLSYGYMAAGPRSSAPYRPMIVVRCQLVRASDAAVLMQDTVIYNPLGKPEKVITLAPDPAYAFVDFDAITSKPKVATDGLLIAFAQTADAVGTLLH
jgi:hypothetical protein